MEKERKKERKKERRLPTFEWSLCIVREEGEWWW